MSTYLPATERCRSRYHVTGADGTTSCKACRKRAHRRRLKNPPSTWTVSERLELAFSVYGPTRRARMEDYVELTREFNVPMRKAITRIPISERTAQRYEADIRAALEVAR